MKSLLGTFNLNNGEFILDMFKVVGLRVSIFIILFHTIIINLVHILLCLG